MKYLLAGIFALAAIPLFAQQYGQNLPLVDLSNHTEKQIVIQRGTETLYNGHPTSVLMGDNKTIICTWSQGHGGRPDFIGKSKDGGLTWECGKTPADWQTMKNCPSIYRLKDKKGKERLFVFCQDPLMGYSYSEDQGKSWSPVKSLNKPCVMAFSSIVQLKNGDYLGVYHTKSFLGTYHKKIGRTLQLWSSVSHDGGLTWDPSVMVGRVADRQPCEPCVFYSPDKKKLVCIARDNSRKGCSLMMTSTDEGKTWSYLRDTAWGLTGDRHVARYLKDGRLLIVFRDMAPNSPTRGHFVAWVGTFRDLERRNSGQYRVKLLHSFDRWDCGYPGLEILPDGTIVAITYIKYRPGKEKQSLVAIRFKIEDTDALLDDMLNHAK